ncbi:MAG: integrase [Marinobacter sp.]|nr:integrase [Legionellales bacterium]MBI46710.1 integrase [Marinobacter sp.]MBI46770.1 integrase [Marinobacter sp.]|tara:strand:+ start:644 stop:1759 length:1116 start_codon:yes stop_codon:yes gene_type:complete
MSKSGNGLRLRGGTWHIEKRINGRRIRESTGTSDRVEAEQYLVRRLEEIRQASVYGVRPSRIWREAALRYAREFAHKRSIKRDVQDLKSLDPHIGKLPLSQVHSGTLQKFIDARRKEGVKAGTVNRSLAVARRILRLCAELWRDEYGMTWLETAPMIPDVDWKDKRDPAPVTWAEQGRLFQELPEHLKDMAEFAVHTGCRESEICALKWEWEVSLPDKGFGFILPASVTKNGCDRLVVLNATARAVVNRQRGKHEHQVFTFSGRPVASIFNNAWRKGRKKAGLTHVRGHDLRHTFGRRLRAAGVNEETRAELLGHKRGSVTTHYSGAEVAELVKAVELIAEKRGPDSDGVAVVKFRFGHKMPTEAKKRVTT